MLINFVLCPKGKRGGKVSKSIAGLTYFEVSTHALSPLLPLGLLVPLGALARAWNKRKRGRRGRALKARATPLVPLVPLVPLSPLVPLVLHLSASAVRNFFINYA